MASGVIEAWLELEPIDRQVAVLRLTYPQWATEYVFTPSGLVWRAVPCWQLTVEQLAAGVARRLERGNPVALMADLSDQARIIRDLTAPRT